MLETEFEKYKERKEGREEGGKIAMVALDAVKFSQSKFPGFYNTHYNFKLMKKWEEKNNILFVYQDVLSNSASKHQIL